MKKGEGRYYKIARPDGWDFYTGKTINYRANLGREVVVPPTLIEPRLCTPAVIHASRRAEDCFQGGTIPCSLYRVQGTPVVSDATKAGFRKLAVLQELDPATHFKWRYAELVSFVGPLKIQPPPAITPEHLALLRVWALVRAQVWAQVRALVRALVREQVRALVREQVWALVWAYTGWVFAPVVPSWRTTFPFQSIVDLWHLGLIPSYDGTLWRLHGGSRAKILWEGTV